MGNDAELDAIIEHFDVGRLRPPIDSVHPLEDARVAFERLASGEQFGKLVVRIAS
jgi:NADPH:quinone reductase-like Zn-dependent oxidoreductase